MDKFLLPIGTVLLCCTLGAQNTNKNSFRQMHQEFATPGVYRTASGAPGHAYYQQKADYNLKIVLDEKNETISGSGTINYTNNSPDNLEYLWLQLDQNVRAKNSAANLIKQMNIGAKLSIEELSKLHHPFDGGFHIEQLKSQTGENLSFTINGTMLRINLEKPLKSGTSIDFNMKWWYKINDRLKHGGRSGFEYFTEDENHLFTIAQFYPRMAVYNEVEGWQNKQFLGGGEFALPFGDYQVSITVPEDHIVGATGELQNMSQVLSATQIQRYNKAKKSDTPVIIVNQQEAEEKEKEKKSSTKTWVFKAENVRDFAFASSRKFIWDAMAVNCGGKTVMAMSFYPKEGNPLWERYSTKVVAHTIKTYGKFTFDYPYPVAISVHSKWIGMEYPMICFNFGRPEKDGTYSEATKNGMIGVIIHEVGHNFFPMIVNSDERQWTWMDEGLNTFLQYLTEMEWDRDFPSKRGPAYKIVDYMKGDKSNITPIMTNSESIIQFGNNAYGKPATALNILRETILGRELFDYAFKMYANRWKFKHPTPEDFFRTMEDASGTDLDWFWRSWFYTTDHVDLALDEVNWFQVNTGNPFKEKEIERNTAKLEDKFIGVQRNKLSIPQSAVEKDTALQDFYFKQDPYAVNVLDEKEYKKFTEKYDKEELDLIAGDFHYYQIKVSKIGGIPMPIILEFAFIDGTVNRAYIPAEIWKDNQLQVSKVFVFDKKLKAVSLDPSLETADVDLNNNYWPPVIQPTRFEVYKNKKSHRSSSGGENQMQRAKKAAKQEKESEDEE